MQNTIQRKSVKAKLIEKHIMTHIMITKYEMRGCAYYKCFLFDNIHDGWITTVQQCIHTRMSSSF